jgi:hypothetical protein
MTALERAIERERDAARQSDEVCALYDAGKATKQDILRAESALHRAIVARCRAEEVNDHVN